MASDGSDTAPVALTVEEVRDLWPSLTTTERIEALHLLVRWQAEDVYLELSPADQCAIVRALPTTERRMWLRLLAPDDVVDLIQHAPADERGA